MLIIEYCPFDNNNPLPDGRMYTFVTAELELFKTFQSLYGTSYDRHIIVNNSMVIDQFRLAIKNKDISHTDVAFLFKGEELLPSEDGRLPKWPSGFCDIHSKILAGLVSRRTNK